MEPSEMETVLVVCADPDRRAEIIERLHDEGVIVVGAAHSAALALALTAQRAPRSAVLAGETAGRRNTAELAQTLSQTWGVECILWPAESVATGENVLANVRLPILEALRRAPLQ